MARRIDRLLSGVSRSAVRAAFALALTVAPASADNVKTFNIPVQEATTAIRAFGQQAGLQVLASVDDLRGKRVNAVVGQLDVDDALRRLLAGTGLTWRATDANTILIEKPRAAAAPSAPAPTQGAAAQEADTQPQPQGEDEGAADEDRKVERVVVTGTHIRGKHPKSSPVDTYTAKDIERSGATTTEQFIQKLPQNFGTRTQYGAGTGRPGDSNLDSVAAVDLRGLGEGTTLVLLNGRRLGLSDFGRAVDLSLIPVSAIERVEVLTDGASAIYGSDAVGGVVNFVLRKDFDGADSRASYGGVTSGGLRQGSLTQTFGHSWDSGNALAAFNLFSASALDVTDRSYSLAAERGTLTPIDQRQNALATFSQEIGAQLLLSGDLAFARRDVKAEAPGATSANPLNHAVSTIRSVTDQAFVNLGLDYQIADTWNASVIASFSKVSVDRQSQTEFYNQTPPTFAPPTKRDQNNTVLDVTAMLDGELFALPGGAARFAIGVGVQDEDYEGFKPGAQATVTRLPGTLARKTTYAFGELLLPFIAPEQDIPLLKRLELTLAGRYTKYDDDSSPALDREFGDSTDPKVGLLWAPLDSLSFRATYGTSFRAPSLVQLDSSGAFAFLFRTRVPPPSGPLTNLLIVDGDAVPDLGPETAETYTAGFDFEPTFLPSIRLKGTYYNISYTDRIAIAPQDGTQYLITPDLYPDVIYRPPSAEFIRDVVLTRTISFNNTGVDLTDPNAAANLFATNPWVVDRRFQNLAVSEQDGFDVGLDGRFETDWGDLTVGADVTRILSYRQQASDRSVASSVVDRASRPVDLRARVHVGLSTGGVDGTISINYVDDYTNPLTTTGPRDVESWTTVDLSMSYDFSHEPSDSQNGVRINVSVQNLFDEEPPFIGRDATGQGLFEPVGFDPANANPLGRVIVVGIAKRW